MERKIGFACLGLLNALLGHLFPSLLRNLLLTIFLWGPFNFFNVIQIKLFILPFLFCGLKCFSISAFNANVLVYYEWQVWNTNCYWAWDVNVGGFLNETLKLQRERSNWDRDFRTLNTLSLSLSLSLLSLFSSLSLSLSISLSLSLSLSLSPHLIISF